MNKLLFTVSALILVILLPVAAFAGNKTISDCGTIITEPGNYKLAHDLLACPGAPFGTVGGPLVILSSDVKLNLKGHTIECDTIDNDQTYGYGVFVAGGDSNIHIKNGTISGCNAGVLFVATSDSSVSKVTVLGSKVESGFAVPGGFPVSFGGHGIWLSSSTDVVLKHNQLLGNESAGVFDNGSMSNKISHNVTSYNQAQGIFVNSVQKSKITCNEAVGNGLAGVLLGGTATTENLVKGNVTSGSFAGIGLLAFSDDEMPSNNTFRRNRSEGNFYDLSEALFTGFDLVASEDAPCKNDWRANQYVTQVGPLDCIAMSVELDEDDICALDDDDDEDDD